MWYAPRQCVCPRCVFSDRARCVRKLSLRFCSLPTKTVVQRIKKILTSQPPKLIKGFNMFLPVEHHIETQRYSSSTFSPPALAMACKDIKHCTRKCIVCALRHHCTTRTHNAYVHTRMCTNTSTQSLPFNINTAQVRRVVTVCSGLGCNAPADILFAREQDLDPPVARGSIGTETPCCRAP